MGTYFGHVIVAVGRQRSRALGLRKRQAGGRQTGRRPAVSQGFQSPSKTSISAHPF